MFIYFWKRDRVWAGEGQRERETQNVKQAPVLWTVSTEPDVGLERANHVIMTWAEVGCLTDWAPQAPPSLHKCWASCFHSPQSQGVQEVYGFSICPAFRCKFKTVSSQFSISLSGICKSQSLIFLLTHYNEVFRTPLHKIYWKPERSFACVCCIYWHLLYSKWNLRYSKIIINSFKIKMSSLYITITVLKIKLIL